MLGQLIVVFMALSLWPLIVQSIILSLLAISLITHVPNIYSRCRWSTRLWPGLVITLLLEGIGTVLVMREPFSGFPTSMAIQPTATIGLVLSSLTLFAWVVATELTARIERLRQEALLETGEDLDNYLAPFPISPSTDGRRTASGVR